MGGNVPEQMQVTILKANYKDFFYTYIHYFRRYYLQL